MPLINQHLTAMLKRREKICWTGKIILGLKRVYFYNNIFESVADRETGRDTQTVFVNFAATLESWWIVRWLPTAWHGFTHSFLFHFFMHSPGQSSHRYLWCAYWAAKVLTIAAYLQGVYGTFTAKPKAGNRTTDILTHYSVVTVNISANRCSFPHSADTKQP